MITPLSMLRRRLAAFRKSQDGNVAIIFALTLLPIIGLTGAAIDYSRASVAKSALQSALDATALAMSKDAANLSENDLSTKASAYFAASFNRPEAKGVTITAKYSPGGGNGSTVTVTGEGSVSTMFLGLMGINNMPIGSSSKTTWGSTRLRVALALDNTPSMDSSGKMTALKAATKSLLDQLKAAAGKNGDVYVSIVPFSTDVNVGSGNSNAGWIDWTDWDAKNGKCSGSTGSTKSSCEKASCSNPGITSKNTCESTNACSKSQYTKKNDCEDHHGDWGKGDWKEAGTWQVDHSKWTGCVMDRDQNYDVSNASPAIDGEIVHPTPLFPADPKDNNSKSYCSVSVLPQTYNWTDLQQKVTDMSTELMTNTTIGLAHAWQTLTDGVPYSPPAIDNSDDIKTQKIIIFLTDGENTQNRWSSHADDIDNRMKTACTNAKADNITIFTVLVMEGNESLLKSCASPDDAEPKGPKYFKLTAAAEIATTFKAIGTKLSQLRIAQ